MVARAEEPISAHFVDAIIDKLEGKKMTLSHLRQISPEVVSRLESARKQCEQTRDLGLFFEDGTPVTADSFDEYERQYVEKRLTADVSCAFEAFRLGFFGREDIDCEEMYRPDTQDLRELCSASRDVNWNALRESQSLHDYAPDDTPVQLFWSIFESWTEEMKKKMLWFITGSEFCPLRYSGGGITLKRVPWNDEKPTLPLAHTCLRCLDLPAITDRGTMEKMLGICIEWGGESQRNA
jgi:hypothetical protein